MKRRHMKLPNGFGQITKLKGKLRKPYRAMVTVGTNENGRPICKILKPQGYFETYNEAYEALLNNSKNPYDKQKDLTVKEIYDIWLSDKKDECSKKLYKVYKYNWKYLAKIGGEKIVNIKTQTIKDVINSDEVPDSQHRFLHIIMNGVFDYAVQNDIVAKNYSRMIKIKSSCKPKESIHSAFSEEEVKLVWENINDPMAKYVIIQMYTGMRPNELIGLKKANINGDFIVTGSKTKAGMNRKIPIHPAISDLIANFEPFEFQYLTYRKQFIEFCERLNIKHIPHDPRKTFITLAKKYQLNEYAIKLIVGHKIQDVTEGVYTERSDSWLIDEISKIPCMNNV